MNIWDNLTAEERVIAEQQGWNEDTIVGLLVNPDTPAAGPARLAHFKRAAAIENADDNSIYRTLFLVEVFTRGPLDLGAISDDNESDLSAIDHLINYGDGIGRVGQVDEQVVPADEVHAHLLRIGNDGTFFTDVD